jgi:hypothetical protein
MMKRVFAELITSRIEGAYSTCVEYQQLCGGALKLLNFSTSKGNLSRMRVVISIGSRPEKAGA